MPKTINSDRTLATMAKRLAEQDRMLDGIYQRLGAPPLWSRKPGLQTLIQIVLEQQVSLASGKAAYKKLKVACDGRVATNRILQLGERGLRDHARLTRQKSSYVVAIANATRDKTLNFKALDVASDQDVRDQLMLIKGIGIWTSDVYLLMALRRPDILPLGDIALFAELAYLCKLNARPNNEWLTKRGQRWKPYRAVAARMIWHSYLDRLGRHHEI